MALEISSPPRLRSDVFQTAWGAHRRGSEESSNGRGSQRRHFRPLLLETYACVLQALITCFNTVLRGTFLFYGIAHFRVPHGATLPRRRIC